MCKLLQGLLPNRLDITPKSKVVHSSYYIFVEPAFSDIAKKNTKIQKRLRPLGYWWSLGESNP